MTILFDFDGTLHNTRRLYGQAFRCAYAMLVREGFAPEKTYTDEEVSIYLGMTAPDMWNTFMPSLPQEMKEKAGAVIGRELIEGIRRGEAVLYDGIRPALQVLKEQGHRLLVLSNCREAYMKAHRQALGLDEWFEDYFCGETYDFCPKEQIFPFIRQRYPDSAYCMIGDRASDIQVGLANGIPTIGCLYGFGDPEELSQATQTVHAPAEIPAVIVQGTLEKAANP